MPIRPGRTLACYTQGAQKSAVLAPARQRGVLARSSCGRRLVLALRCRPWQPRSRLVYASCVVFSLPRGRAHIEFRCFRPPAPHALVAPPPRAPCRRNNNHQDAAATYPTTYTAHEWRHSSATVLSAVKPGGGGTSPQPVPHVTAQAAVPEASTTSWHGVPHTSPTALASPAVAFSTASALAVIGPMASRSLSLSGARRLAASKLVIASRSRPCCARAVPTARATSP